MEPGREQDVDIAAGLNQSGDSADIRDLHADGAEPLGIVETPSTLVGAESCHPAPAHSD
jgi:hypothetical protein